MNQETIDRNAHISTDEIKQDIADTENEIVQMEREIRGFELLSDRWSIMRAESRRAGINERQEFIKKLRELLDHRGVAHD